MVKLTAKAFFTMLMVMFTKVNLSMTRPMAMVFTLTKKAQDMKVLGRMISRTDLERNNGPTTHSMKEHSSKG